MEKILKPQINNGIPEVTVETTNELSKKVKIIDVREPHEFNGELGHIAGAELAVLGPALLKVLEEGDRNQDIIFVCRSGGRSGQATQASLQMGYKSVANMIGGMLRWNELKLPIEK